MDGMDIFIPKWDRAGNFKYSEQDRISPVNNLNSFLSRHLDQNTLLTNL